MLKLGVVLYLTKLDAEAPNPIQGNICTLMNDYLIQGNFQGEQFCWPSGVEVGYCNNFLDMFTFDAWRLIHEWTTDSIAAWILLAMAVRNLPGNSFHILSSTMLTLRNTTNILMPSIIISASSYRKVRYLVWYPCEEYQFREVRTNRSGDLCTSEFCICH